MQKRGWARRGHRLWKDLVRSSSRSREGGEESLSQWRWWREVGRDEDTD